LPANSDEASARSARNETIIRERECKRISGLSRSTRWRLEREGEFPRRRKISPGAIGWLASEIATWLAERAVFSAGEPGSNRATSSANIERS
jgi:prophage regulatory protein